MQCGVFSVYSSVNEMDWICFEIMKFIAAHCKLQLSIKIGPKGLSYCVYWRAAAAAGAAAAAIVSPVNKIFVEALLLLH